MKEDEIMKVYRVYVDGIGCVATVFSLAQVAERLDEWTRAGYEPTFEIEEY